MSSRSYRSWASRSAGRSSYSSRSYRSFSSRPSSSCSLVESNFRVGLPETPVVPEVYITRRNEPSKTREISINDAPMMLLPKARVRDSLDYYDSFRRSYSVVADTSVQGLHISTIQSITGLEARLPTKSALKSRRNSISRSEADSGFCSLKRTVTFENLNHSQSTVFRSDDEFDNMSVSSDENEAEPRCEYNSSTDKDSYPDHLESFGSGAVIAEPTPRSKSRQGRQDKSRRKHGQDHYHDVHACEICGMILSDRDKVQKSFGKVDTFLDWVMSKWGPEYYETLRRELQYIPRPSYVYRGHTPHFCNFVQQVSLHSRQANCTDSTGIPDSEFDDEEFIMESADGRLINKYRKSSTASSRGSLHGLTQVPNLDDYECDTGPDSIPEIKEDTQPSGTEGRPGSPSSLDGDSLRDLDSQQAITGVAVRVSSPVKLGEVSSPKKIDSKPENKSNNKSSYTGTSIPEEDDNVKDQTTNTSVNDWDKQSEGHNSNNEKTGHVDGGSDANNRIPSPRQPPPSPEPIKQKLKKSPSPVPLPVTSSESTKKRSCINKKTKKPVERKRKMKQIEETKVPETVKVEETPPTEETTNENDSSLGKIDLKVPELPSNLDNKDKTKKEKSKVKKHLIETEDDLLKPDPNDILNEQMKLSRTEFDWSNMDSNGTEEVKRQPNIKSWIQGRLALSQQSSRFELPMDMKNLEKMTPQEYIRKHCIITSRRQNLYQKIFLKNKDKSQAILFKDLDRSLKDVLVNTITSEQIHEVLNTLQVDENTKVDYKLFAGMAAYAERVLYPSFVTEDTQDMPEYQKEKIECADFCALPWKLHGVKVNPEMKKLLEQIS